MASGKRNDELSQARADTVQRFSSRQADVLEKALQLLVDGGEKGLTTAGLARAANCSKESLYKWFGDRQGLLEAVITFQAGKVGFPDAEADGGDARAYQARLRSFVTQLMSVLFGETSLALNRLAIGQAGGEGAALGTLLLERGKRMISANARTLLEEGRSRGLLSFDDPDEAYSLLYGLVIRDCHVRMLLGEGLRESERDFMRRADEAVTQFYRLCCTDAAAGSNQNSGS
ncbi:TetR/AcrR family transcriptional regulator [Coralliovum pocilloporae]|uniref:TetR/AcrR family transcriptional regulator n=1 Tax=Coralliovum pocilloporae TaxID=3066369 RepID=UPI003D9C2820